MAPYGSPPGAVFSVLMVYVVVVLGIILKYLPFMFILVDDEVSSGALKSLSPPSRAVAKPVRPIEVHIRITANKKAILFIFIILLLSIFLFIAI